MKKKSLISGLFAIALVFSSSIPAFADSKNKQYDMTPGYTDGFIILRGDPSNTGNGGFKICSGDDHHVQISFPGDYIGETAISITNNNPDVLKIALANDAGDYLNNDDGTLTTISGTTFTRTSSTKYDITDLEQMAVSLPTTAGFVVIGAKTGTATITCTYTPSTGSHVGQSFTETVPFEVVDPSQASPLPDSFFGNTTSTYKSDTGAKVSLGTGSSYQFKITSLNGKKPTFFVPGKAFKVTANGNKGKDYFFTVQATGKDGDSAGAYINGDKTPSTVLSISNAAKIDTGKKLTVKVGKTYQFKITSNAKPNFRTGNSSVFKVAYNGHKGNEYYYIAKAVGKVGQETGFYLNNLKKPVTIGSIG